MIRCFAALDLPEAVRAALPAPPDPWRPVAAASLHITLAFLGSVDESRVPAIAAALEPLAAPLGPPARPGPLAVAGVVLLPPGRPRVMAVRLQDPSGASIALQSAVSDALAALGVYEPERRAWLPHVTIARARGRVDRRAPLPEVTPLEFTPPALTLYRSRLGGNRPATYEPLARFALV